MMQQQTPTQLPEGLAALLSLTSAMQQGRVAPTTPDGQPTVAAQAAQAAQQQMGMQPQDAPPQGMPPGPEMQDVAQNAGMAAQQQAQQQQEMMQQLPQMIAAMQQRDQAMDQGIASAPGAQNVNMAEGGIVGYSGGDLIDRRRAELEAFKNSPAGVRFNAQEWEKERQRRIKEGILAEAPGENVQNRAYRTTGRDLDEEEREFLYGHVIDKTAPIFNLQDPIAALPKLERAAANPNIPEPERQGLLAEIARIRATMQEESAGRGGGGGAFKPNINVPAMPGQVAPPDYSESDKAYQDALAKAQGVRTQQATPQEALEAAKAEAAARRQFAISQGVDPDVLANTLKKQQEIAERRQAMYEQQLAGIRERAPLDAITSFLTRGARGGRSLGQIMAAGAEGSAASWQASQGRIEQLQELQVKHQEAAATAAAALEKMRYDIAMGDYKSAMESRNAAIRAENEQKKLEAEIIAKRAGELGARSRDEYQGRVTQRQQDITGRGQTINAETAEERLAQAIAGRSPKEIASEAALERALNSNPRLQGLRTSLAEIIKNPLIPDKQKAIQAIMAEMRRIENEVRSTYKLNPLPKETAPANVAPTIRLDRQGNVVSSGD